MAVININLDDVDDGTDPLPEGQHLVRIKSAEAKHKEGSEYPYILVTMNALDVDTKYEKRNLRLTLSHHPNALWNMKRFMKAAGIEWEAGIDTDDFPNKELFVTVKCTPSTDDPNMVRNEISPPYSKA